MKLEQYFEGKPRGAKAEMARRLGVSKTWLSLIINGREHPSAALCVLIQMVTQGEVRREELRPDLFGGLK